MGKRSAPLKHPILTGFLFIWFAAWVALGAAGWWRDTVDPE